MEAEIGDKEAAADHEIGHALIGTFENGWDSLRRAWIVEGNKGWGGGTTFDRLAPDAKALARVALAGSLAEGKRGIQRAGHVGQLLEHQLHAQNIRAALDRLKQDEAKIADTVEIQVNAQVKQVALSLQDAAYLEPFTPEQLTVLVKETSDRLNEPRIWGAHGELSDRLLNPPQNEDPDINHTHVWQALFR